jgi:hypothetical protein
VAATLTDVDGRRCLRHFTSPTRPPKVSAGRRHEFFDRYILP